MFISPFISPFHFPIYFPGPYLSRTASEVRVPAWRRYDPGAHVWTALHDCDDEATASVPVNVPVGQGEHVRSAVAVCVVLA